MHSALGPWSVRCIVGLFWLAAGGICWRYLVLPDDSVSNITLAIALILVCIDQGRMAWVDLANIHQISLTDQRVVRFYIVTLTTIVIELIGFYLAWHHLVLGMAIFLISQLLFNTAAKVRLYPHSQEPIRPFPREERWPVLVANGIALSLIALWQADHFRQLTSMLWLSMVVIYLIVKYWGTGTDVVETEGKHL